VIEAALNTGGCLDHPLCGVVVNKVTGLGANRTTQKTIKALGLAGFGVASYQGVGRYYIQVAYPGQPGVRLLGTNFEQVGARAYREIGTGRLVNLADLEDIFTSFDPSGQQKGLIVIEEFVESVTPAPLARAGRGVLNNAFPFFVDVGFQLYQDWNNPYLTPRDKFFRAGVSGLVGTIGGGVAYGIAWIAVGTSTPPGWVLLGTGIFIGVFFENPISTAINEAVFPEQRNLRPLE
jgi:hypothetical protein